MLRPSLWRPEELPHVPAEGVDRLFLSIGHAELLRFIAVTAQRAASAVLVRRAAIVVAKLDQNKVAGFEIVQHTLP